MNTTVHVFTTNRGFLKDVPALLLHVEVQYILEAAPVALLHVGLHGQGAR